MASKVDLSDIKSKLDEIKSEVDTESEAAKPTAVAVGIGVAAVAVGIAYSLGSRRAKKQTTVVEIRRV